MNTSFGTCFCGFGVPSFGWVTVPIYHLDFATWLFAMGCPRWRAVGGPFRSSGGLLRRGGASAVKRGACLDLCASAVHVEF